MGNEKTNTLLEQMKSFQPKKKISKNPDPNKYFPFMSKDEMTIEGINDGKAIKMTEAHKLVMQILGTENTKVASKRLVVLVLDFKNRFGEAFAESAKKQQS